MSIIAIQLKQVLRNRRFFLFTILLPGIWYVFMIQVASTSLPPLATSSSLYFCLLS